MAFELHLEDSHTVVEATSAVHLLCCRPALPSMREHHGCCDGCVDARLGPVGPRWDPAGCAGMGSRRCLFVQLLATGTSLAEPFPCDPFPPLAER